jgi:hypothetical protein
MMPSRVYHLRAPLYIYDVKVPAVGYYPRGMDIQSAILRVEVKVRASTCFYHTFKVELSKVNEERWESDWSGYSDNFPSEYETDETEGSTSPDESNEDGETEYEEDAEAEGED